MIHMEVFMQKGKVTRGELEKLIEITKSNVRDDIIQSSGIGIDCAVIDFGDYGCVLSCDPITCAKENMGKLAVHINCNDIATTGGESVALLVMILCPEDVEFKTIEAIMRDMKEEADRLNVEIIGGHTEITSSVNSIILAVTAIGKINKKEIINNCDILEGFDIIVTKKLCIEGSYILVNDFKEKSRKILNESEMDLVNSYISGISVVRDGIIAKKNGACFMHDITEGGLLGALSEMSIASNMGFEIWEDVLPISKETKKLCEYFNIDPLRFISSGSMLIISKDGNKIKNALKKENIECSIIGKTKKGEQSIWIDGLKKIVEYKEKDEIYKLFKN